VSETERTVAATAAHSEGATAAHSEGATAARIDTARRAGFYPLVLLLERLQPEPIGSLAAPLEEPVRFRHAPDLSFSPSDVLSVEHKTLPRPADDAAPDREFLEVTTAFLGLTGGVSPLPTYLTEELLQDDEGGAVARGFLDLFHHRLLSLLYRSLARCDLPGSLRTDCADLWSQRILMLLGFDGPPGGALPAARVLRLAGLLADGEVTARTLELAIEDALAADLGDASVAVEQFIGTWVAIDPDQLTRLGRAQSRLGRDLLLGSRVFDRAGKFRITVGPLTSEGYARFARERAPPAAGELHPLRRIEQVAQALLPGALEHEVVLWLRSDAAPSFQLAAGGPTRLGQNSWLGSQSREARITVPHAA
jgi:type VI secretion system protein ImpH